MGTVAYCVVIQTLEKLVETVIKNRVYKEIVPSWQGCNKQNPEWLLNEMDHWSGLVLQLIRGPVTIS